MDFFLARYDNENINLPSQVHNASAKDSWKLAWGQTSGNDGKWDPESNRYSTRNFFNFSVENYRDVALQEKIQAMNLH